MSKYNDTLLTTAGQALATRAANGSAKFSITRAVGSKTDLSGKTDAELVALTALPDETQIAQIVAEVDDPDGSTGITGTQVTFQNKNEDASIDEGYTLNTIGLFAKEEGSDKEILYALTTADEADYIPDFADNVFYKFTITIYVVVGQKANVTVAIDVTGTASIDYVNNTIAKAMQNLPKDIARTGENNTFTGDNVFTKAPKIGNDYAATLGNVNNKVAPLATTASVTQLRTDQDTRITTEITGAKKYTDDAVKAIPKVDLSPYYTGTQVDAKIAAIPKPDTTTWQKRKITADNGLPLTITTSATTADAQLKALITSANVGLRTIRISTFTPGTPDTASALIGTITIDSAAGAGTLTSANKVMNVYFTSTTVVWREMATLAVLDNYIKVDPNTGFVTRKVNFHYGDLMVDSHTIGWTEWVYDEATAKAQTALYPANIYLVGDDPSTTGGAS